MATKPPVTMQADWETTLLPWLLDVAAGLEVGGVDLDVDRVHLMTGVCKDQKQTKNIKQTHKQKPKPKPHHTKQTPH
jgi:hypothetical protein